MICCPAGTSLELRSRDVPAPDNKSLGYCCRNSLPTVINPLIHTIQPAKLCRLFADFNYVLQDFFTDTGDISCVSPAKQSEIISVYVSHKFNKKWWLNHNIRKHSNAVYLGILYNYSKRIQLTHCGLLTSYVINQLMTQCHGFSNSLSPVQYQVLTLSMLNYCQFDLYD